MFDLPGYVPVRRCSCHGELDYDYASWMKCRRCGRRHSVLPSTMQSDEEHHVHAVMLHKPDEPVGYGGL